VVLTKNQVTGAGGNGINVGSSSAFTLSDNTVDTSVAEGVYLSHDSDFVVSGGSVQHSGKPVSGSTKKGVYVTAGGSSSAGSLSLITGVEASANSDAGIYLTNDTSLVRIKGTTTHDNARGYTRAAAGIDVRGPNNVVEANVAFANEDTGINIRNGGNNALVTDNVAYNNGDHGIDVLTATGATIIRNSVYRSVAAGINVEGTSTGTTLANNISVDNGINSPRTDGDIRVHSSSVQGTTADYDLVNLSPGTGTLYIWNSVKYKSLSALHAAYPTVEAHGLQADPRWVNPSAGDLHLAAGSPAIDAANSGVAGEPPVDAAGQAPVDDPNTPDTGAGPRTYDDRGAYEFVPAAVAAARAARIAARRPR
jgi:parallel beta-helix repeat protein